MRKRISIKAQGCLLICAALLCGRAGAAELLGSADQDIKNNFNKLITSNACKGCNLRGAVLNRLNLANADLEGADLSGAWLNSSSLAGANLRHAVLRGARLGGTDISKADLLGADLEGADFTPDPGLSAAQEKNPGQQAADSAQNAVNSAIDELFAGRSQSSKAASPPEEISLMVTPAEPAANRRDVDKIPVIQHENLLIEAQQAPPQPKPADERVNEIVLQQIWPEPAADQAEQQAQPVAAPSQH